ncbi:MAG: CheY-like chemotaxis protein, partial [Sphingobacteriales bacterium]
KKLVSLMNGTIHVESKLDKETTFKLNIPFEIISEKKSLTNGEIVLEKLAKNSYDIILMDLQMPLMDGYQTTINIRNSDYDYIQHIPIIALTAHAIKGVLEKCIEIGVDDYVSKPIGFKELISKIKKVMD